MDGINDGMNLSPRPRGGAGRFTPRSFHTHSGAVVSHPIFFSDQLFYCSNIIIIISGKLTKIVYICIMNEISAKKLKYSIYT